MPLAQFPTEMRGFDAADIDGDGQSELVMLSDTKVLLYHVQESQLVSVASYSDRRPGTLLSAQLVRPGDGQTPGVVVNRYSPNRRAWIRSSWPYRVISWSDSRRACRIFCSPWILMATG